ncbi:uncharacterized protein LOC119162986 isoform X1 [Rhipicephalus microplus]|uniref:uncharacterized protein LOC119162986 isoform X1 n=1 Tax=Rhipicephalus microplus TaxID=6941 RepID=UPI003F6A9E79
MLLQRRTPGHALLATPTSCAAQHDVDYVSDGREYKSLGPGHLHQWARRKLCEYVAQESVPVFRTEGISPEAHMELYRQRRAFLCFLRPGMNENKRDGHHHSLRNGPQPQTYSHQKSALWWHTLRT